MGYPRERKEAVLKKMLPPNNKTIPEISKEEGICEGTLYNWRKAARPEGRLMPDGDSTPNGWCAADKFAAVVETVSMNEAELSAYCRERGLYAQQISEWRDACEQANDWDRNQNKRLKDIRKEDKKRIKELKRDLKRQEMKSKPPLISIGVPVYNEELFIEESLSSLLAQDYVNIEIIISDNASTDKTASICQRFADKDSRIIFHCFDENRGARENFQYVLDHSSGGYFMWAAGHDLWSPNTITECVNMFEEHPESAIAIGSSKWIDENGNLMTRVSGWTDTRGMHPIARFFTVFWGNMHPVLGLVRSRYLKELGEFQSFAGADLVLLSKLALKGDFIHASKATWLRREFRHEHDHSAKLTRYRSAEFGLSQSLVDRYFPLFRLPLALIGVVLQSTLPLVEKSVVLITLLPALSLRYLVGKR